MKRRIKRKIRYITAVCMAVCMLTCTACSSSASSSHIISQENISQIVCAWWGNDGRHQYTVDAVENFEAENTDINVNCSYSSWNGYDKRMHIYMKSKNTPDVMLVNYAWISEYSSDGNGFYDLYQLSDYIDLSNYTETELTYGEVDGKLNAIPIAFNTQTLYYNKTLFDQYNLELPKTWDDLFECAKVMSKDDIYPVGVSQKSLFMLITAYFTQTTGREIFDENGELDISKDDISYMLEFYKRLIDEKVVMPIDSFDRNAFVSCKVAGTAEWISDAGNYCEPLAENGYDVVVGDYPTEPGAVKMGWYVKPATMYAISSTTDNPEESARLLDYLLNSEDMAMYQGTEKGIPISDSAYATLEKAGMLDGYENQANEKMQAMQDSFDIMNPLLESENIYENFKTEADFYLYDKNTLEEVTENIYKDFYE
jgi:oligogalacturonide transport system substrate-binding protein